MRKELGYLTLGLTPLLLITLAQGPLLSYQTSFSQAKRQYLDALQDTRKQLADLGHTLRGLPSITPDSQTLASAGRALNGFIVPGRIDHIAIYDQECNLIANSDQGVPMSSNCPVSSAKAVTEPRFQWRSAKHSKNYEYVAPLVSAGGKSYFLIASNAINQQWLFHHPDFKQSVEQLNLVLGDPKIGKMIYRDDGASGRADLSSLSSQHPLLQVFPNLVQSSPLDFRSLTAGALLLLLLCVWRVVGEIGRKRKAIQNAIKKLHAWADELVPEGESKTALTFTRKGEIDIKVLQDRMSRLVKNNLESAERSDHEKKLLQQQLVRLESRFLSAQAEQTSIAKARSMHQQMHGFTETYIEKLHESQSLGEDISHLTTHEIVRPAQRIMEMMNRWSEELSEVSTRKFVRSLSERVDPNGISELDESVDFLMNSGAALSNAAINLTMLTQKLLVDLEENTAMAKHWFNMMGHDKSFGKNLLNLLKDAQSLIEMQDKEIRYENVIEASTTVDQLRIPTSTLTSVLFHCQMALVENAIDRHVSHMGISNQLRLRDGKVILVSSLRAELLDERLLHKDLSPKAEQHLSLALQMLNGFAIRLTKLPALNGVHAIALLWDEVAGLNHQKPQLKPDDRASGLML